MVSKAFLTDKFLPRGSNNINGINSFNVADKPRRFSLSRKRTEDSDSRSGPRPPRPISPSDVHYHTSNGGCNALLVPLSHHYSSNDALLSLFDKVSSVNIVGDVAYAVGLRYVEAALITIPSHGYFLKEEYREERRRSIEEAVRVVNLLEGLVREEDQHEQERRDAVQRLAGVAKRFEEETQGPIDETPSVTLGMACACASLGEFIMDGTDNLCSMLTMKGKGDGDGETPLRDDEGGGDGYEVGILTEVPAESEQLRMIDRVDEGSRETEDILRSNPADWGMGRSESSGSQIIQTTDDRPRIVDSFGSIATETFVAAPRDSAPLITPDGFDNDELQLALRLSVSNNMAIPSSFDHAHEYIAPLRKSSSTLDISSQIDHYRRKFHLLCDKQQLRIRFLDTYQGRMPGSTNGCTVIAPLLCIQYFNTDAPNGLPDEHIHRVIDVHAATILKEVREKLSLPPDSFIIPSDVHDHLMDKGLLSPSSFVGVCGGNIMDDDHLAQFQRMLFSTDGNQKIASALFFHGHVVAFHTMNLFGTQWVELIDSLPHAETWSRSEPRRNSFDSDSDREEREPCCCSGEDDGEWRAECVGMNAVRARCVQEHFRTLVRHYAGSKLSRSERVFVEENRWEDTNSFFDPRVFQAFVWRDTR